MRDLWLVALCLLLVGAAPEQGKKAKAKHKTFQPIVKTDARGYAGRYVGIDSTYYVDVRLGEDGKLAVKVHEGSATSELQDVHLDGARLAGTSADTDGKPKAFEGVFGERNINGRRAFGLLVNQAVRVSGDVVVNRIFCKRQ